VQGGLVPFAADRFGVPMSMVEPEPWALGVSFREEPRGLRRYLVDPGSPADGARIEDLPLGESLWISFISRAGELLQVRRDTELRAGDEVLAIVEHDPDEDPAVIFTAPAPPPST
jgi:potassium/hydrogen antiporter